MRISTLGLVAAASVAVSGCAYGGFGNGLGVGLGYGNPYGGYGSYGGYGYDPYSDPYYGYGSRYAYGYNPYGYGMYGSPYGGGWYNGYYYPGSGYYVYDRDRNRREMSDAEKAFWRQRVASTLADRIRQSRGETVTTNSTRELRRQPLTTTTRTTTTSDSSRRERVRDAIRTRILERRAERAQRKSND